MNKCVFLDRDGVINRERGEYTYKLEDFEILPGVVEAIHKLKLYGFLVIIITNQAGIARGLYSKSEMDECHKYLLNQCDNQIDAIYFCRYHPSVTESIARKPGKLMFEKAMAKFDIDPLKSWMIGDKERDIVPALEMNLKTILITEQKPETSAEYISTSLKESVDQIILNLSNG